MTAPEANTSAIGILGGTFDPVHRAHLALARAARERLGIDEILWIPAGQPPHRTAADTAPRTAPAHRLAMVQAAIAGEAGFRIDASEVASTAPSYTVHTLERLRHLLGEKRPLVLLMGADAFLGLPRWHRWQELLTLAHIAVATRPGFPLDALAAPLDEVFASHRRPHAEDVPADRRPHAEGDPADRRPASADFSTPAGTILPFELVAGTVSATEVRARLAAGEGAGTLLELLPAPVLDYIQTHSLYRP